MADPMHHLQKQTSKLYDLFAASETRLQSRAIMKFAEKNSLIYFKSVKAHDFSIPIIRGMTSALHQRDTNICIGTHDHYDMVYVRRYMSLVDHNDSTSTSYQWHVMEFDLKRATDLPTVIIGSSSLPKAFYAKLLNENRQLRHMPLNHPSAPLFHAHYAVLAAPVDVQLVHQLLPEAVISKIAHHKQEFTIEIHEDRLFVALHSSKTSEDMLTKMMHYGIWLARHIDSLLDKK